MNEPIVKAVQELGLNIPSHYYIIQNFNYKTSSYSNILEYILYINHPIYNIEYFQYAKLYKHLNRNYHVYDEYYLYYEEYYCIFILIYNLILYIILTILDFCNHYFSNKKIIISKIKNNESINKFILPSKELYVSYKYNKYVEYIGNTSSPILYYNFSIPNTFINLINLDVSLTDISEIPESLINLRFLKIDNCPNIKKLPKSLINLEILSCWYSKISYIPEEFINLIELNIRNCKNIYSLSNKHVNLKKLDINNCVNIIEIPNTFTKLELLNISQTNIIKVHEEFSNLIILDISRTRITSLPNILIKLRELYAARSNMEYIPITFQNLEILILDGTPHIEYIPRLEKLKELSFEYYSYINYIDELPNIKHISHCFGSQVGYINYKTLCKIENYYGSIKHNTNYKINKVSSLYIKAYNIVGKDKKTLIDKNNNPLKNIVNNIFDNIYLKPMQCPRCGKYVDNFYFLNHFWDYCNYKTYQFRTCCLKI